MSIGTLASIAAALAAWSAAPAARSGDTLVVGPDFNVELRISGQPGRFMMMANGGFHPILNPITAKQLKLVPRPQDRFADLGPYRLKARKSSLRFEVGGLETENWVFWFDQPVSPRHHGVIGPYSVPQRVVTFQLRPPASGEKQFTLPLTNVHEDDIDEIDAGMGTFVKIGGARVFVQWDLTRDGSLATSATVADLAFAYGARYEGESWQEPLSMGLTRPVRRMVLDRPFFVGPVRLGEVVARLNDHGDTGKIADAIADAKAAAEAEADEIVVTGTRPKAEARHMLLLGRDTIAHCSSLTFDRSKGEIVLSCLTT